MVLKPMGDTRNAAYIIYAVYGPVIVLHPHFLERSGLQVSVLLLMRSSSVATQGSVRDLCFMMR